MTILFKPWTAYTLFTAIVLSERYYKDDRKILLISEQNKMLQSYITSVKESGVFDEVLLLNEVSVQTQDVFSYAEEIIKTQDIDIFHMFYFDLVSVAFVYKLPLKTKIIITDEGTGTPNLISYYNKNIINEKESEEFRKFHIKFPMDWNRIDCVMLYDERLYDNSIPVLCKKIDIQSLIKDPNVYAVFLEKINAAFSYEDMECDYNTIYFDSYFTQGNFVCADYEKYIMKNILYLLKRVNGKIKLHPNEIKNLHRYRYHCNIDDWLIPNNKIPWEVIFLNINFKLGDKKIYLISNGSMSVYNSIIMSNSFMDNVIGISIHNIFKPYMLERYNSDLAEAESYNEQFVRLYPTKYFIPNDLNELEEILLKDENVVIKDFDLRESYLKYVNYFGNTILKSELNLKAEEKYVSCISYVDYSEKNASVDFELEGSKISKKVTAYWNVFPSDLYETLILRKVVFKHRKETLQEINYNKKFDLVKNRNVIELDWLLPENCESITCIYQLEGPYNYEQLLYRAKLGKREHIYYEVLYQWLNLKQKGINIEDYLQKKQYKKIGIYGKGKLGELLIHEINKENKEISFITNNVSDDSDQSFPVCTISDLEKRNIEFEIVIVTPIYDYFNIQQNLLKYIDFSKIYSINQFLDIIQEEYNSVKEG